MDRLSYTVRMDCLQGLNCPCISNLFSFALFSPLLFLKHFEYYHRRISDRYSESFTKNHLIICFKACRSISKLPKTSSSLLKFSENVSTIFKISKLFRLLCKFSEISRHFSENFPKIFKDCTENFA